MGRDIAIIFGEPLNCSGFPRRKSLFAEAIEPRRGKIVHYAGNDAILAEVATVSNAFGGLRKEHPARNPGARLRQTSSDGALA